jgi:hypothetical protein
MGAGQKTLSKARYAQLREQCLSRFTEAETEEFLQILRNVMEYDPDANTYNAKIGEYIKNYRARKAERCTNPMCDSRGYEQNRGYCIRCFAHLYPEETITKRHKTKESSVIHFLKEAFPDRPWVFDRKVDNGCSRYRPDIFLDLLTHSLIVEVDENQHDSYDCECENKRLMARPWIQTAGVDSVQPRRVHKGVRKEDEVLLCVPQCQWTA